MDADLGYSKINRHTMKKMIVVYSVAIAGAAFVLEWLGYRHFVRVLPTEAYVGVIALGFTALGIWVGNRLTNGGGAAESFQKNLKAIETLGLSTRELEVLELLAAGHSNKEIAADLFVSLNTVKTHLTHLYGKLDVSRRTQAIRKARDLRLIP